MHIKPGTLLLSTPAMDDARFKQVVILITEYNDKGAMGFVLNQPFPRPLNELVEFRHSKAFALYDGGPVDKEHLFFIHCRPDLISGGTPVSGTVFSGGNFKQALAYINGTPQPETAVKLFIGYCGWNTGDLEAEIKEECWQVAGADDTGLLFMDASTLWSTLYRES